MLEFDLKSLGMLKKSFIYFILKEGILCMLSTFTTSSEKILKMNKNPLHFVSCS